MSSDTAIDNASVVDSSLSEWRNDMGNLDGPESGDYRAVEVVDGNADEDACQMEAGKHEHHSEQLQSSSLSRKDKLCNTRYFIIKSLNHQNIQLSVRNGIWATQVMNEPILEEAFNNSGKVILIFSVNMSGFFQGYAQMMSTFGWRRDNVWSQGSGGNNPWGRSFRVKWLRLHDLPFQDTLHLQNPLNDYKPVKISRDCQELTEDIGEALCALLDGKSEMDASIIRWLLSLLLLILLITTATILIAPPLPPLLLLLLMLLLPLLLLYKPWKFYELNVYPTLRPNRGDFSRYDPRITTSGVESLNSSQYEDYTIPTHLEPAFYPSVLYQQNAVASRYYLGNQRPPGGNVGIVNMDQDASLQFGGWGLPVERSSMASTLTDDDILDMTYEEYLEAHSKFNKRAAGPSSDVQRSSSSKATSDDSQFRSSSKKRPRHRSPRR